ncbi:hypothetical protein Barb6_01484 [Bacteroidales bacterium Barb6]|nr:hypothetical protein Barb6_01484 [Bacteroidales bacterium Barb6]
MVFYFVPKLSGCLTASVPDDKIREPFYRSVNGNPNPLTVFLNRHKRAFRQLLPLCFFTFQMKHLCFFPEFPDPVQN